MKFFKDNKKLFIGIIIGIVLASCVAVFAATYHANEVQYTDNKTVKVALDDLYTKVPSGKKTITTNDSNIDVANYAAVDTSGVTGMGKYWKTGSFTVNNSGTFTVSLGFQPAMIFVYGLENANHNNCKTVWYYDGSHFYEYWETDHLVSNIDTWISVSSTGFSSIGDWSTYKGKTYTYLACAAQ